MAKHKYDPERHHRRSIRLRGHDYSSSGAYMATICTQPRRPCFERLELRTILEKNWQALPHRFKGVQLDEFVVMPDHIHFILWLDADLSEGTIFGDVVGAYKSLTTVDWLKYIKANRLDEPGKFWQDDFYERVIRNEYELMYQRTYIRNNPLLLDT